MAASARDGGNPSLGELLRNLAEGSGRLVRQEVDLARLELTGTLHGVASGTAQVAIGGVLAVLGLLALVTGVIVLIGREWAGEQYWLVALIATVVLAIAAWLLVRRGRHLLTPSQLKPDQTIETLKEDKAWLKRRLTSGATSS